MNKEEKKGQRLVDRKRERIKETLLLCLLAIVLIFVVWQVFGGNKTPATSAAYTEKEIKIARLLQEMEGVGEAEVMIYEGEDSLESVVVLCEGATDLRVIMSVREAVATALGTEEKKVKVYLKKE
ncbi:MAG: hypothetical protein IJX30_03650 [Clostridia bacterium]|nr:hypothetical protein [Clostridia bacterium]